MIINGIELFYDAEHKTYNAVIWYNHFEYAYLIEINDNGSLVSTWEYGSDYDGLGEDLNISVMPEKPLNILLTELEKIKNDLY